MSPEPGYLWAKAGCTLDKSPVYHQFITGPQRKTNNPSHSQNTYGQVSLHVFASENGENPSRDRENLQTPVNSKF